MDPNQDKINQPTLTPPMVEEAPPLINANGDESDKKDLAALASAGGGTISTFSAAFGNKPNSFFTLLAAAAAANKNVDKGTEYLHYLQNSGIKMAWVRAIVALYEEPNKPDDPLEYIVRLMGLGIPEPVEVRKLQDIVTRSRAKLLQLQAENFQLRQAREAAEAMFQKNEAANGSVLNIYDQSKYFSDYNSDDGSVEEISYR